jgi:hypothetical protein
LVVFFLWDSCRKRIPENIMGYWAVARTQPQREEFAIKMLAIRGFQETYLPLIKERVPRKKSRVTIIEGPLFANYLFIALGDFWWDAHHCPGVVRLLLDGIRPAKVRDGVVEALKAREVFLARLSRKGITNRSRQAARGTMWIGLIPWYRYHVIGIEMGLLVIELFNFAGVDHWKAESFAKPGLKVSAVVVMS